MWEDRSSVKRADRKSSCGEGAWRADCEGALAIMGEAVIEPGARASRASSGMRFVSMLIVICMRSLIDTEEVGWSRVASASVDVVVCL